MTLDEAMSAAHDSACRLRPALEAKITRWLEVYGPVEGRAPDAPLTTDFCMGASCAALAALRRDVPDVEWRHAGGPCFGRAGGMSDLDGRLNGHFWVEGRMPGGGGLIVDLTADQFGHEAVVVCPSGDPRYVDALPPGIDEFQVRSQAEWSFGLSVLDEADWQAQAAPVR